jgi:hypothetical protein
MTEIESTLRNIVLNKTRSSGRTDSLFSFYTTRTAEKMMRPDAGGRVEPRMTMPAPRINKSTFSRSPRRRSLFLREPTGQMGHENRKYVWS